MDNSLYCRGFGLVFRALLPELGLLRVLALVLSIIRKNEIGQGVVGRIFIFVMNFLPVFEQTAEMVLHNDPVEVDVTFLPVRSLFTMGVRRRGSAVLVPSLSSACSGYGTVLVDFEMNFLGHI